MVVFACNTCGESLRKNQVEKHYRFQCRNCEVLSCIDCGKDFPGDSYLSHNACISEAEKYQKAEYKPKPSSNKGLRKQNEWVKAVENAVCQAKAANIYHKTVALLEKIKAFDNVPQSELKFINFVRNCVNVYDTQVAKEAYQQLRDAFAAANKARDSSALIKEVGPLNGDHTPAKMGDQSNAEVVTDRLTIKPKSPVSSVKLEAELVIGTVAVPKVTSGVNIKQSKKRKFDFVAESQTCMLRLPQNVIAFDLLHEELYSAYTTGTMDATDRVLMDVDKFRSKLSDTLRNSTLFFVEDDYKLLCDDSVLLAEHSDATAD